MSSPAFIRVEGSQLQSSQVKVVYTKGERCGIENCRSKKYREEDGKIFCSNGHEQQNVTQTQEDDDDFGSQGRKTRRKREVREKVSRIYRGHKALELYLQSYQIILRKQCYSLVHQKGFPAEFESAVRDLWALRLQLLREKATTLSDSETESRLYSSQDEAESDSEIGREGRGSKASKRFEKPPALIESLGLCYLGAILLRLPLSIGDLHSWAIQEDIPFIRAIRFVPSNMRERLPSECIAALDTLTPLRPDKLCIVVNKLVDHYKQRFDMTFPALNTHLLLFKHIRNLSLPVETYATTQDISSLVYIDFSFLTSGPHPEIKLIAFLIIATKLHHPFDCKPRYITSLTDPGTLTIDWATWSQFHKSLTPSHKPDDEKPALSPATAIKTTESDIFNMNTDQLDAYLDWYEKTYISTPDTHLSSRKLPQQLLDMFPTSRPTSSPSHPSSSPPSSRHPTNLSQQTISHNLHQTQSHLLTRDLISSTRAAKSQNPVLRIGSEYKRYRKVEDLHGHARAFYETAAAKVGVSLETVVRAVLGLEKRIVLFKKEFGEYESEEDVIGTESDDNDTSEGNDDEEEDMDIDTST